MNDNANKPPLDDNKARLIAGIVIFVAIALLYIAITVKGSSDDISSRSAQEPSVSEPSSTDTHSHDSSTAYEDGSYTATSSYSTPGGSEDITISITLEDNVVTGSEVSQVPSDQGAAAYQAEFKQNYKPLVEGRKISEINLSRVSGSSLTSRGFNDAVESIKSQAHHPEDRNHDHES